MLGSRLYTGDKFFQDDAGYFPYAGRTDDMLKSGGIWVSPGEVEAAVTEPSADGALAAGGRTRAHHQHFRQELSIAVLYRRMSDRCICWPANA